MDLFSTPQNNFRVFLNGFPNIWGLRRWCKQCPLGCHSGGDGKRTKSFFYSLLLKQFINLECWTGSLEAQKA
ncbi:hypothetical protein DVH24_042603 [Malus domestica]|uniref:Uncharacterized protein n=1 Tax=Malus domestica TaxID=3750 RepID=A0A498KUV3_MALDO|nr:hypothetical protein DVH24_042603 [Malus domestica]